MRTTLLLADDHRLFRDALRPLLHAQSHLEVVGEAATGAETVSMALELRPSIVLMDISMPDLNGIEATRRILSECPEIRIIMLSMHSDRRFITEALRAGARGYILKESAAEELIAAVNRVSRGEIYLTPGVSDMVVQDFVQMSSRQSGSAFTVLSSRERQVLQLLAEGRSTKEIATSLEVSVKTIETHRRQIMEKLDLHSVAELTKYAIREGLTSLD
jgi:DNA-binding NarL/FixJ family response regulator